MRPGTVVNYALLIVGSIIVAFPLLLALSYSLMSESEIATFPPPILPADPSLDNYGRVFATIPIGRYLLNSFVVSSAVVATCVSETLVAVPSMTVSVVNSY